jgi:hypothetical protein
MRSAGRKQPPIPPDPIPTESIEDENERRIAWATAMITVARRTTADLTKMPLVERRAAMMRASVLSEVAQKLLSGKPMPPSLLDSATRSRRPRRWHRPSTRFLLITDDPNHSTPIPTIQAQSAIRG